MRNQPADRTAEIKEYTSGLHLLFIEADQGCRDDFLELLEQLFARVSLAASAAEGLLRIREAHPDLVITDHQLPDQTSLELLETLQHSSLRPPVLVLSGTMDLDLFSAAINLGAARFLPRSITHHDLLAAISSVARDIFASRSRDMLHRQEMELLRYRSRYHSQQQELALRKERHLLRNDLSGGLFQAAGPGETVCWLVGVCHQRRDIMCGDAYMIRHLQSGEILIFLVDAMGAGLSASLTSVSATSCINFLVDLYEREQRFDFGRLVSCFLAHSRTLLLDDEVLSCGFLHIGGSGTGSGAFFGLPPVLANGLDGSITKISGGNPPVTNLTESWQGQQVDLRPLAGLLLCSDGLTDAETTGGIYRERLGHDLAETFLAEELGHRFRQATAPHDDDTTFIRLSRLPAAAPFFTVTLAEPCRGDLALALRHLEQACHGQGCSSAAIDEFTQATDEALMNAFEHGCLAIGGEEKQVLIENGRYDSAIEQRATGGRIRLTASLNKAGDRHLLLLVIEDSGHGFDLRRTLARDIGVQRFQGRGITLIRSYTDHLAYNTQGNQAYLMKFVSLEGS